MGIEKYEKEGDSGIQDILSVQALKKEENQIKNKYSVHVPPKVERFDE